jgi:hypothetical protein
MKSKTAFAGVGLLLVVFPLSGCGSPLNITTENFEKYTLVEQDFSVISEGGFTDKIVQPGQNYFDQGFEPPLVDECSLESETLGVAESRLQGKATPVTLSGFNSKKTVHPNLFFMGQSVTKFETPSDAASFVSLFIQAKDVPECTSLMSNLDAGSPSQRYGSNLEGIFFSSFSGTSNSLWVISRNGEYVSQITYQVIDQDVDNALRYDALDEVVKVALKKFAG